MKLYLLTIVLDGMPFIHYQKDIFAKLDCDWHWFIVEGAAANMNCTSWCKPQRPRHSGDGTLEYINSIRSKRIHVMSNPYWVGGKVQMCNWFLPHIAEPGVLMQIDVDEFWTAEQLQSIVKLFDRFPAVMRMYFRCLYYVGPRIIAVGDNCYGNNPGEWLRAWRFRPGMHFDRHEPPVLAGNKGMHFNQDLTAQKGLVFDHMAYVYEQQVAFKERFYGYKDAVMHWRRLQANAVWPVKLKDFLPWVDERVMATIHI